MKGSCSTLTCGALHLNAAKLAVKVEAKLTNPITLMFLKQYEVIVSSRDFQKFIVEADCESEAEDKALDMFSDGNAGTPMYNYDADVAVIDVREAPSEA